MNASSPTVPLRVSPSKLAESIPVKVMPEALSSLLVPVKSAPTPDVVMLSVPWPASTASIPVNTILLTSISPDTFVVNKSSLAVPTMLPEPAETELTLLTKILEAEPSTLIYKELPSPLRLNTL